ncbi:MAG: EamA family transporter [Candidatus Rokubacteria bacterium]|nr:EamA family transporter [Candidatus Rokubacteria bacterium]
MTGTALALVVGAAVLHAAWNALAKQGRDPLAFLWSSITLAGLWLLPFALWWLWVDGLPAQALPFVSTTIVLHAFYFYALGRAYRSGEFSLVYPIARGLGVALVPVLALFLFDERPSPLGAAGVALVVLGIVGLHLAPGALGTAVLHPGVGAGTWWFERGGFGRAVRQATRRARPEWWALVTGLTIAAYSLVDKAGVARLHPVVYIGLLGFGSVLLLLPAVVAKREALRREWATNWRAILVASTMNLTSYLLVLFAFRLSKVGYVVAARELSIVLSAIIGARWLGEGRLGPRLAGAAVVLAGVACVAAAR